MLPFFNKKPLLPQELQDAVAATIAATEKLSTGEIRVYVESHCKLVNPILRCEELFVQLEMHKTLEKNGVLLYLAIKDRQFAIVGDKGINDKVGGNKYWEHAAHTLEASLRKGAVQEGLCACIEEIGKTLSAHFPDNGKENINELPDEIVFGR